MIYFAIYILVINTITLIIRRLDKYFATKNKYRVSEKKLICLCIAWWRIWWLIWSNLFHHKSSKISFWIRIYVISIIEIWLLLYYIVNL